MHMTFIVVDLIDYVRTAANSVVALRVRDLESIDDNTDDDVEVDDGDVE